MDEILYKCILIIFTSIFSILGTYVSKYFKEITRNEIIDRVVEDTVLYVEQVFKDIHGKEKLQKGIERSTELLNEKGIKITYKELETLLEAAVNDFQEEFRKDKLK